MRGSRISLWGWCAALAVSVLAHCAQAQVPQAAQQHRALLERMACSMAEMIRSAASVQPM